MTEFALICSTKTTKTFELPLNNQVVYNVLLLIIKGQETWCSRELIQGSKCHVNCVDVMWCANQNTNHFGEPKLPCMNFFALLRVDAIPELIWGMEKKKGGGGWLKSFKLWYLDIF